MQVRREASLLGCRNAIMEALIKQFIDDDLHLCRDVRFAHSCM
jgi:hypothetical protein